jgi:hypothetical protein
MIFVVLLSLALILLSVLLLGIKVFFTKNGRFPNTHIGSSKEFREKGIHCAKTQDLQERNRKNLFDYLSGL